MASGSYGTRDKLNPLCRPARESDVIVGATFPGKKGQVYIGGAFGSMRQILNLPSTQGFCDNKPEGRAIEHMRRGRPIGILPHTSEIQTNIARFNHPCNAK